MAWPLRLLLVPFAVGMFSGKGAEGQLKASAQNKVPVKGFLNTRPGFFVILLC